MRRECLDGRRVAITAREVYLLIADRTLADVYQAVKSLRVAGLVRFVAGSRRLMEIAPGAPEWVEDGRGRAPGSVAARGELLVRRRNNRASMSTPRPVRGRAIVAD
jgi:hypothetical protein